MTERIPQSTSKLVVFKAYLASDHTTEATGKTITVTISKNGATSFSNPAAGATNATEMASGWYKVSLGTGDTDTLGPLAIRGAVATIDDVGVLLEIVSATTGGYTNLDAAISTRMATYTQPTGFLAATFPGTVASTTNITAGTITTATNVTTVNGLAAGVITATSIAADAITDAKVASDVTIASVTGAVGSVTGAVGSVTGNVGGNVTGSVGSVVGSVGSVTAGVTVTTVSDKTGYALTAAYDAAKTAATQTSVDLVKAQTDLIPASPAATGDIPTAVENADALLDRNMATGADSGSTTVRTPRQALRFLRNKWSISGTTLTVTKENDTTASWTAAITQTPGADPITGSDPAGP